MRSQWTLAPFRSISAAFLRPVTMLFTVTLAIGVGVQQAWATSTATITTLAVTSAGSAVTEVPAKTVVTLTATVKAGATPLTAGQVNFCDAAEKYCTDIHLLSTAQLTKAGTATFKFIPGIGEHGYKAVFLGTNGNGASSSSVSALSVTATHSGKYPTTTTLTQSEADGTYTLTATVAGSGGDSGPFSPSGTISFLDTNNGHNVLATADLPINTQQLSWTNSQSLLAGESAWEVAVGDFNGDGKPDLAVRCEADSAIHIFLGNGDGTFTPMYGPLPQAGNNPVAIAAADFNSDGKTDLVVSSIGGGLTILLGNGDGTFNASPGPKVGRGTSGVAVGDFNQDGVPDLVVGTSGDAAIFLGNGDGTFTSAPDPGVNGTYTVVGDFNGDGTQDVAVWGGAGLTILLSNGDGTFTAKPSISLAGGANTVDGLVVADFNGDGKADLAASGGAILLGNGDGTFQAAPSLPVDSSSYSLVVGDFSGDGIPGLAFVQLGLWEYFTTLTFFVGNGDGTFTALPNPVPGFYFTTAGVGDFNGDGRPDLAVTDGIQSGYFVAVWLTETQAATASANISLPSNTGTHLVDASYSGDGDYSPSVSGTTGLLTTGAVSLSGTGLSFGDEPVNDSTPAQSVQVTNTGVGTLNIHSIKLTGTNSTSFVTSNTCGASLAVGATCRIGVRFTPIAAGPASAAITLTDGATDSPQSVTLSGTGIAASTASLRITNLNLLFGNELVGESTGAARVFVTNTSSTAVLYFKTIALGGPDASSFVTSNTCGGSVGGFLNPGATCRIGVRFVPTGVGVANATITLTDNTSSSPQIITLSGTGK